MSPSIFAVCPHDTARGFDKWALLNTVANRHLALGGRFDVYLDFATFGRDLAAGKFLWAYVNPADFLALKDKQSYVPIARPAGRFDVAYLISRSSDGVALTSGARIAAVPGYLGKVVSHALRTRGQAFEVVTAKSYNDVMTIVRKGEADVGITYNEHFDALSSASSEGFSIVERFDASLTHVVVAHPELPSEARTQLGAWLTSTQPAPDLERVENALGFKGFEAVQDQPFDALREVLAAG